MNNMMLANNASTAVLESVSVDFDTIERLSNIGEIGRGVDFSDNALANELQNQFPLLTRIMSSAPALKVKSAYMNGSLPMRKDADEWKYALPWTVGTTPPEDTTGECCWVPLELTKCGKDATLRLLCLKDCETMLDNFILKKQRFQAHDLIGYFMKKGQTIKEARRNMAKLSMAWFTAHNIILGTTDTGTAVLKPFPGLLQVMEDAAVVKIDGSNILAAFDSIACRMAVLGETKMCFAMHPMVYEGVKAEIVKGKNGEYPEGWTKNEATGDVKFRGHELIADKLVPVDLDEATGEIWGVDLNTVGAWMATSLQPEDAFTRSTFTTSDVQADGCANECDYYYNFGGVFSTDTNRSCVITNVPFATACVGPHMTGTDYLLKPDTIVPIAKADVTSGSGGQPEPGEGEGEGEGEGGKVNGG